MFVGAVWGINSLLRAYIQPVSPMHTLVFTSPLVSVFPRILMPLVVGLVVAFLRRKKVNKSVIGITGGLLGSILNTVFVLGSIAIFKQAEYLQIKDIAQPELLTVLWGIVIANGVPEMIASGIITPAIYRALDRSR